MDRPNDMRGNETPGDFQQTWESGEVQRLMDSILGMVEVTGKATAIGMLVKLCLKFYQAGRKERLTNRE